MSARWIAAIAMLVGLVCFASSASAEPRPYDAPRVALHDGVARVPPPPPEYLPPEEEAGIKLVYHPAARERVLPLVARAPLIRAELSAILGREVLASLEIRVAAMPGEIARLSPGETPAYATAVAFAEAHLVVLSLASPLSTDPPDLEDWLRHEMAHVALDEVAGGQPIPRWFHEGFAACFAGESAAARAEILSRALIEGRSLALRDIDSHFPADAPGTTLAYAEAADFARFLTAGSGRDRFAKLLERVRGGASFDAALTATYDTDLDGLDRAFHKDMARRYSFLPVLGGATILWVAVATVVLVRRARARKRAEAARRERSEIAQAEARVAPRATAREPLSVQVDETIDTLPLDPEVPKIEHDGRWHTLH